MALPALISAVMVFNRCRRSITGWLTGIVALLAFVFGAPPITATGALLDSNRVRMSILPLQSDQLADPKAKFTIRSTKGLNSPW